MADKKKLLVVEDIELNRVILRELFSDNYDVLEAENGQIALDIINEMGDELSIILLDLVMPVMDGFGVLREMNKIGIISTLPVIMITGENDDEKTLEGYSLGVSDLIGKPFNPDIVLKRVDNVASLYGYHHELERRLKQQREELEEQSKRLRESNQFVIDALSTTVEFRSLESGEHIHRVRMMVKTFLREIKDDYNLNDDEIEMISNASAVHDIGKIAIPDSILLKPGRLTPEEFEIMKTHSIRGCEILESLNYTQDQQYYMHCYEICRHHHERWDGGGYPDGLKGDEISIWAQATSLADVYDALTSKRVYKDAFAHDTAVKMILDGECGQFNPRLLESLVKVQFELKDDIDASFKRERENKEHKSR